MLEPNDSETNLDNAEDACKSDYFSDEGEVKSDTVNSENVSTGKRKPTDIGPDEAKKIKVHVTSAESATDKAAKLPTGSTSSDDFKRASSVTSDNSDEFVDAVDVLEPSPAIDKKPAASTDDVDACAVKNPASDNVRKSILESEGPKVKENKFISRLPTFADDPLDRFNSSAIRRGFFKETETVKADYNFDVHPSDKNETKNENKVVKKVKLNRSKFFNTDKPKFSDESSSDSNPKFNNATSPVKPETVLSSENKNSQSIKIDNKSTTLPVDEKTSATKQPPAAMPSSGEIPQTATKPNSTVEPETVRVENDNSLVRTDIVSTESSSTSSVKKNTQGAPQDQCEPQVESISLDVPRESEAVPESREVINSKIDVEEANKLIEEVEMMEQSSIELVLETTDDDEKIIDSAVVHKEPISVQRMEPEPESIMLKSESQSIEPESQSAISEPQIIEPEPQSIEPEPSNIECSLQLTGPEPQLITPEVPQVESKPDQYVASSSVLPELPSIPIEPQPEAPAIESPTLKQIEDEIIEQPTYQTKKLNDDLSPLNDVSTQPALIEPEVPESESKSSVPESVTLQESLPESNLAPEVSASDSAPLNELIDEKESTIPDSELITATKLISEKIIPEPENLPEPETQSQTEPAPESEVQNVDLDITTESEDIADDKSEPDVSNEESEGELEEEEEEIHEEELYLEDRMPPISKPRDPTPPRETVPSPVPVASPPTQKRSEEVVEMDVDDQEIVLQLSDQSAPDSPVAEESIQPVASSKSVENIPVEQIVQSTPSLENTENISAEKSKQPMSSSENIENTSVEKSNQPTPSLENIENTSVEKSNQPTPSVENTENISAEKSKQPMSSSENIENTSVEKLKQPTLSLENIENTSVEKSKQLTPSVENTENISVEKSEQPAHSVQNTENISAEKPMQPTQSVNITEISVEKLKKPTILLENIDISTEKPKQATPPRETTENVPVEKPKQPTPSSENITEISVEKLKKPTILLENIDISTEKPKQATPPRETTENVPVEKPKQPTPSSENITEISVEKLKQPTILLEKIEDIPAEKPQQPATLLKNAEDTSVENSIQPTSSENIKNFSVKKSKEPISSIKNDECISVERPIQPVPPVTIKITPIKRPAQPTRSESTKNISAERSDHRKQSLKDIENIPMDIDDEPELITTPEKSTPSKQTTTPTSERAYKELSKLEQALTSRSGVKRLEVQVPLEEIPPQFDPGSVRDSSADGDETKGKIKLHLSLQGDKVSIKKGPSTAVSSTGEVKVKRQYRKRNKDGNLKPDKTYKLRNRSAKADDGAAPENGQNDKPVASASTEKCVDLTVNLERKLDKIYSAEPILIDSDDSTKSAPTKVQPIKLKITKNSNVTIECTSSSSEVDKNREVPDDIRKKESIPNMMEQAATAWSGPDLQRVERLLKESNITITPVIPKEAPPTPHTISRPIPSALKERPSVAPKFSTPSVTSTVSSLQTAISSITPISRDKFEDSPSKRTTPQRPDHQNGEAIDHLRFRESFETPVSYADKQIDIKSEIRKMLASADKRKIEPRDLTDAESDSSDSKPKLKAVPDLVPINLPTPEMLQSLASSLTTSSTSEGESSTDKSKAELDSTILPLLQTFPKKRGRPTKAMVAAREALKQSQEAALENLKQLATQKASEGQPIPVPILDITDPEDLFKPKRGRKSRSEKMEKSSDAEQSASEATTDPEREAEENKKLEEERIKKEEEKERRNEIRRQKARERNDLVKAKRLRQKMKAEERQKRMQEKRRMLQEEKKKLEEEIKNLPKSLPSFDDETRMSAENSQSQNVSFSTGMGDEDSSNATTELSQRVKKSRMEVTDIDSRDLTVDQIAEYQWPIQGGDLYMIQEQVSNYLGVKSFKRKYPDIKRRPVDSEEKAYLVDSGLVSETLCDLGLTAVSSAEVLDIMCADFPDKYEELRKYMREKQMKELSFKQKAWASGLGYKFLMADGTKQDLKKRAMESASNWNSALNKSRSDDRRCAIDLQTFIIHYPKTRTRKMTIPTPKMGSYPVSILPGQFCDFYKTYTSTELRYMPINTVMYGPLKPHATAPGDGSQTDSDDSSSSDESSTSSEGTQGTEDTVEDIDKDMSVDESSQLDKSHDLNLLKEQMTMELSENTRELIMDETAKILCKICLGNITRNKENVPEVLIYCSQCSSTSHPSCLDLSLDMVPHIKKYAWQCPDCKICARCKENADEDKMLFCDICDRGYHIYCVGLKKVPSGRWQCQECTVVENNLCLNNSTPVRDVFKEPGLIEAHDG